MAKTGIKKIAIMTPGFASDCIETLEEINISLREDFLSNGGKEFTYIKPLNDSYTAINMYKEIIEKYHSPNM